MDEIVYSKFPGKFAIARYELLEECSSLYSNHYGKWSDKGVHPGKSVKLSPERLIQWLENEGAVIYYASHNDRIVGYAIAVSVEERKSGVVTWVTQLVVHTEYRHKGIAKNILFSIWGFSNHFAWGIVSANPYAIRALEKATRRRAIPIRIKSNVNKLKRIGRENVSFIDEETEYEITETESKVNTQFYVDHEDTLNKIANVTSDELPWLLGTIEEGWEWFAFTFKDQEPISLSKEEIESMIETSDSIVSKAYSRMNLESRKQGWMKNTRKEVDYIDKWVDLSSVDLIYDLGCGIGRHVVEFGKRGKNVVGVDYIDQNVTLVKKIVEEKKLENIKVQKADCRYYENEVKASLVTCLYDVVGTFSDDNDNIRIIETAYNLLKSGGHAVFSVMNYESTYANAKHCFDFSQDPNQLLTLEASDTMESTGEVFNSDYYLVDTVTHLVYRREQFSNGNELPIELVVRDKRYTMSEIISMCIRTGFEVIEAKYTNASGWENSYSANDKRAKEILVVCRK